MERTVPIEQRAARATAALALAAGVVLMPAVTAEAAPRPHAATTQEVHDPFSTSSHTSHDFGAENLAPTVNTTVEATDYRPYARQFAHSAPNILQVPASEIQDVMSALDSPMMIGGARVTIRGWASAEDDAWRPYAGMLTPSAQNQELATKRGEEYMKTLATALDATPRASEKDGVLETFTKDGVRVDLLPGKEQQLTQAQAHELDDFAQSHGYADARHMVIAYDADQTYGAVTKHLDETLARSRKVEVTIESTLPIPVGMPLIERADEQKLEPSKAEKMDPVNDHNSDDLLFDGLAVAGAALAFGAGIKRRQPQSFDTPQVPLHPLADPNSPERFTIIA